MRELRDEVVYKVSTSVSRIVILLASRDQRTRPHRDQTIIDKTYNSQVSWLYWLDKLGIANFNSTLRIGEKKYFLFIFSTENDT